MDEEVVREAALACPTAAIELAEIDELLPWQLRTADAAPRQVVKTFMFTDIVGSNNLAEVLGDEAWQTLVAWHDEALRTLFAQYSGHGVVATGDGFFVDFDSVEDAVACATGIQRSLAQHRKDHGFAPQVRASGSTGPTRGRSDRTIAESASTRRHASPPRRTEARSWPARRR